MRFYTENVQHDYCTHKEFPSLFLHARHLLPAADHGKECGSDRYYATASICIISYSVEPRQFNANTAFFHFYEHFHPLTPKQAHLSVCLFSVYYSLSILRPAVSYHRISRSDIVLAAMMTSQQASGLPARTTARTAAGTARAETDNTALAYPTATSVV